jgi:hypothetical protein
MRTEITVFNDAEDLPPDPEFEDQWNTMLVLQVRIDMYLINRSPAPPEEFLDQFLLKIKQQALNHFYERYPERMPDANPR